MQYTVQADGTIVRQNGTVPKQYITPKGYARVWLDGRPQLAHRVIALALIPNPDGKPFVNHIDEDKLNNTPSNLEWVTALENNMHGTRVSRVSDINTKVVTCSRGESWLGREAAAKAVGVSVSAIDKCLNGSRKTAAGLEWYYA